MKKTITVVLAVKNEEDIVEGALKNSRWAEEIIVVDQNSTDRTVEICKRYTDKVIISEGGEDGTVQANWNLGFDAASSDWIQILAADERIPEKAQIEILELIQRESFVAYETRILPFMFGKFIVGGGWLDGWQVRLFKRGVTRFNETGWHVMLKLNDLPVGKLKYPMLHFASPDIYTWIRKMNHYTTRDAKMSFEKGFGGIAREKTPDVTGFRLFWRSFKVLIRTYFVRKGYIDGIHGLILSVFYAFYIFLEDSCLFELQYKDRNNMLGHSNLIDKNDSIDVAPYIYSEK